MFIYFQLRSYKAIVQYKTAYYSFYLPVALAMYMVGEECACLKMLCIIKIY